MEVGAERGASAVQERGGVFDEERAWDVLAEIPEDSAGGPHGGGDHPARG